MRPNGDDGPMTEREPDKKPRVDLSNVRDLPPPEPKKPRVINVELPPYDEREGVSAHDRLAAEKARRPSALQSLGRTLLGFAAAAAVIGLLFLALSAIDDDAKPSAAWSKPEAPVVTPGRLDAQ